MSHILLLMEVSLQDSVFTDLAEAASKVWHAQAAKVVPVLNACAVVFAWVGAAQGN